MAIKRFFHESNTPELDMLNPAVPPVDVEVTSGRSYTTTGSQADDKRPAVWLWDDTQGAHAFNQNGDRFRYTVEIEENDQLLVRYDFFPGCYRYLEALPVTKIEFLDSTKERYFDSDELGARIKEASSAVEAARAAHQAAVTASLGEADQEKKGHLESLELEKQKTLKDASETLQYYESFSKN